MLHRRLITLFILFAAGFLALGFRLANLQLVDTDQWRTQMRDATHREYPIDTARGSILDRHGVVLAKDVPCDDLAVDYRAMNLDDRWLRSTALKRIQNEKFDTIAQKRQRIAEVKAQIASQVEAIPEVISQVCKIDKADVMARYEDIRQRIHFLREDRWFRRYDRENPSDGDNENESSAANDDPLDLTFKKEDLTDERRAHTIVHNLSPDLANFFRQHINDYPGLVVRDDANTRLYPNGDIACQVIGTLHTIPAESITTEKRFRLPDFRNDAGNLAGYQPGDMVGESGAEKVLESQLHGTAGAGLRIIGQSDETPDQRIEPIPGKDIKLTLDIGLQRDLHNALKDPTKRLRRSAQDDKDHNIALVVLSMDGQILSMISWPTYDPNFIDRDRLALNKDEARRPLANRTLEPYQPGSTVKPLLASAGLTEGVITPETTIVCNGYLFPDRLGNFRCAIYQETHGRATHGPLQLEDAIAQSCNIYFYTLGGKLGIDKLVHWFDNYGLGRDSGCELYESNGFLPRINPNARDDSEERTESLFLGIGQGRIGASPLQMANAYATLLRGGLAISPSIILDNPIKQQQRFRLDPSVVATVRAGMERVITAGTARDIFKGMKLDIAGKTGTADTSRPEFDDNGNPVYDQNHPLLDSKGNPRLGPDGKPLFARVPLPGTDAWFIGYAPSGRDPRNPPKFIIAAVMEFGGFGGKAAAPMVKEAILQLEKHNYLQPADLQP